MKLAFYSGGNNQINEKLDLGLIELIGKRDPKIGYIPSSADPKRRYFNETKTYYGKYGLSLFFYFDLEIEFDRNKLSELGSCDAIYLSGGNTFHFLYLIKKRKLVTFLKKYIQNGNVLIGVSAGSMIMTPSINITAAFHSQKGDLEKLNAVRLRDFRALNLVNFEFIPHFNEKEKGVFAQKYSKSRKHPIYACNDGSGIIVNGQQTTFYGKVIKF